MRAPRFWTEERLNFIRKNIHLTDEELAVKLNSTYYSVNQARLRYRILRPKKVLRRKTCPLCKKEKHVRCYHSYYSQTRQAFRLQPYCMKCEKVEKARRSADYYKENKAERLQYAKQYRQANKEKVARKRTAFRRKYIAELKDCYVAYSLAQKAGVKSADVRKVEGLIEVERARLKLIRSIKTKRHEK